MKVAIMQPYFLPYIGYWQLINAVDVFVVYDNIKYTKKGWINRNRLLLNGKDALFSLPLSKGSDYLDVSSRFLADNFSREKLLNQFKGAYSKAPYFEKIIELLEHIIKFESNNLFDFIHNSIVVICQYLGINTKILVSSTLDINHQLTAQDKVIALCQKTKADIYINPIGGIELYDKSAFKAEGIDLFFIKSKEIIYPQFNGFSFVPWLSVIDLLMFNSIDQIRSDFLNSYELI